MKKTALVLSMFMLVGLTAAVEGHPSNGDGDMSITGQPGETPVNDTPMQQGNRTGIGDLPAAASDTAKRVAEAISNAFQEGLQGLGEVLREVIGTVDSNQAQDNQ